jgi:transcriptional regulator with XRE-family HTH domain
MLTVVDNGSDGEVRHAMERPPVRPEGALIRLTREAAGLSIPDVVKASGVSKARWSQVETSRESRNGVVRQVTAKAATVAHMARAVGLSPERLETEGERPDAAEILREILRAERPSAASPGNPFAAIADPYDEPEGDRAWDMFPNPEDRTFRWIWRMPVPVDEREQIVHDYRRRLKALREPPAARRPGYVVTEDDLTPRRKPRPSGRG